MARLPVPEHPQDLGHNEIFGWLAASTSVTPNADTLKRRMQRQLAAENGDRSLPRRLLQHQLQFREYSQMLLDEDRAADDLQQQKQKLDEIAEELEYRFQHEPSNFFPVGFNLPAEPAAELTQEFMTWIERRLAAQTRYTVTSQIIFDPLTRTSLLKINPNANDQLMLPGDVTQALADKGIAAAQVFSLKHLLDENLDIDQRSVEPVLALPVDANTMLQSIPGEFIEHAADDYENRVLVELVFEVQPPELLKTMEEYKNHVLLIAAKPVSAKVLHRDQMVYEGPLDVSKPDGSPNQLADTQSTQQQQTDRIPDQNALPLAPAHIPWLIARHHPELFKRTAAQITRLRWQQENEFRREGERSKLGVDPKFGIFFPLNTPQPAENPDKSMVNQFQKWMLEKSQQVGDRYLLRLETKFGPRVETANAFPQFGLDREKWRRENIQRELDRKRQLGSFQNAGGGGFGGGGGLGVGTPGKGTVESFQQEQQARLASEIARLEQIEQNLNIPIRTITFSDQAKHESNYQFVIPNLSGARRVNPGSVSQTNTGVWDPDAAKPTEPVIPILVPDKEYWLPASAGIDPAQQSFTVELDFHFVAAESTDVPPEPGEELIGEFANEPVQSDDGEYVVFKAQLESVWILHPRTGEKMFELELKEPRQRQKID